MSGAALLWSSLRGHDDDDDAVDDDGDDRDDVVVADMLLEELNLDIIVRRTLSVCADSRSAYLLSMMVIDCQSSAADTVTNRPCATTSAWSAVSKQQRRTEKLSQSILRLDIAAITLVSALAKSPSPSPSRCTGRRHEPFISAIVNIQSHTFSIIRMPEAASIRDAENGHRHGDCVSRSSR